MNHVRALGCLIACGLVGACAAADDEASPLGDGEQLSLGESEQPIVRGVETDAFPQVVMLHVQREQSTTRCSGSLIAPRVILTAAHCIGDRPVPGASYVYFGDDAAPPSSSFPEIPPPGEPSELARVESFRVHPDYDPAVNYPDVAIVYLDRALPFAPLPLLTERLGRRSLGEQATIVGWGGSRALTADISQVEGAGIKRKGKVTLLGSPTAAEFHEDDPNPGMLDPEIRADSLKADGSAPNSNGCAGDSGGPLLVKQGHKTYVAGVAYWTGLFCEDYSIYARIDPLLHFIKDAIEDAQRAPLHPRLECIDQAEDGTYTAYYGYESENGSSVEIPHGLRNVFFADRDGLRPEVFAPGDHPYAFSLDFERRDRLAWLLRPKAGPSSLVLADRRSPTCDFSAACDAALASECNPGTFTRADCIAGSVELNQIFPGCQTEIDAYWQCIGGLSPAAENWVCDPGFLPQPAPPFCEEEFVSALVCGGYL
jgi:secreted trypsin-like serine protease